LASPYPHGTPLLDHDFLAFFHDLVIFKEKQFLAFLERI